MKKMLLFIVLLTFCFGFDQCVISGPDQIQVGERQVYKETENNLSCNDCYEWSYLDQKVLLESNSSSNEITLKGSLPGEAILSLEIKGKEGINARNW
jgi:hypothetical protein